MEYYAVVRKGSRPSCEVATFPACPGAVAQADRGDRIEDRAADALELWLEGAFKLGQLPPLPGRKPRPEAGARILLVRVPAQLAARIELRRARHEQNLTQAELAQRAGVSQNQIAKLEHFRANPTLETLEKVACALGKRLDVRLMEG